MSQISATLLDRAKTYYEVLQEDGIPARQARAAVAPMLPDGFDFRAWLEVQRNGESHEEP